MPPRMAVQVTIYLNEADHWHHRPLHMEILNYLRRENVAGATALHAVAGFTGRQRVTSAHLVDAGGKVPVIITFIDSEEDVYRELTPRCEQADQRLLVMTTVGDEH